MKLILSEEPVKHTASGIICSGPCIFRGFLLGTDGANDPTVTIYNGQDNSGTEIVPTATYDASALGINGVTGKNQYCSGGLYVEISCAGAVEIVPDYAKRHPSGDMMWQV